MFDRHNKCYWPNLAAQMFLFRQTQLLVNVNVNVVFDVDVVFFPIGFQLANFCLFIAIQVHVDI